MLKFFISLSILTVFSLAAADEGTIIDACGRDIVMPGSPKKIIAIGPGAAALTVYADMSKYLVAKEAYGSEGAMYRQCSCAYPDNYASMPVVYNNMPGSMPDYDAIIEAKPQLVLASGFNKQQIDTIYQSTRVPVAAVNCSESGYMHYDTIVQSLRLTGYLLKKEKEMQNILNFMAKVRKELYMATKDVEPAKIFIISETYGNNKNVFTSERCYCYLKLINSSNLTSGKDSDPKYLKIDRQELLKIQPEYIFIEYPLLDRIKADYAKNKQYYKQLKAVKENRVFTILPYNHFMANIENMMMNAYFIGKTVYSEKFKQIDMHRKSDEITEELTGNDYYSELVAETAVFKNIVFDEKGITIKK